MKGGSGQSRTEICTSILKSALYNVLYITCRSVLSWSRNECKENFLDVIIQFLNFWGISPNRLNGQNKSPQAYGILLVVLMFRAWVRHSFRGEYESKCVAKNSPLVEWQRVKITKLAESES